MVTASYKPRNVEASNLSKVIGDGAEADHASGSSQNAREIGLDDSGPSDHDIKYENGTDPAPLNIAIVGAGIGGLTAAIGLRQNGHNVSVSPMHCLDFSNLTCGSYMSNRDSQMRSGPPSTLHLMRMEFYANMDYVWRHLVPFFLTMSLYIMERELKRKSCIWQSRINFGNTLGSSRIEYIFMRR